MVSLQMQDVAFEAFLAVHKDDHLMCESTGAVPRRLYSGNHKSYIELRTDKTAAVERAVMLFGKKCHVQKDTILLLRIQFSYQGFTKYATNCTALFVGATSCLSVYRNSSLCFLCSRMNVLLKS